MPKAHSHVGLKILVKKLEQRRQVSFPMLTFTWPSSQQQMSLEALGHHRRLRARSTLTHFAAQCLLTVHFKTGLAAARSSGTLSNALLKSCSPILQQYWKK